ncbi:hypothetical protein SDC9_118702 [bioreactor metagenome]|uniref:Uncharacterized protein n=1 Tax=bioreactor metagenome TaxID=1076179 RepID=A0A645C278_9ZZZZ
MRIACVHFVAHGNADELEHFKRMLFRRLRRHAGFVEEDDFVHLLADGEHRVEARHGLLKDHGDFAPADMQHFRTRHLCDVVAYAVAGSKADLPLHDLALRRLHELHERKTGYGFAATALANDADGLAARNIEAHAVDGLNRADIGIEERMQIVKLHNVVGIAHRCRVFRWRNVFAVHAVLEVAHNLCVLMRNLTLFLHRKVCYVVNTLNLLFLKNLSHCHCRYLFILGSNASRRPSPMKLNPRTVMIMRRPAGTHMFG